MEHRYHLKPGAEVFGADGAKFGKVRTWDNRYLVVEKGMIFTTDYYVPFSAVENSTEQEVFLNVTKDAALNQGWETPPTDAPTDTDGSSDDKRPYVSGAFRQDAYEIDNDDPARLSR